MQVPTLGPNIDGMNKKCFAFFTKGDIDLEDLIIIVT